MSVETILELIQAQNRIAALSEFNEKERSNVMISEYDYLKISKRFYENNFKVDAITILKRGLNIYPDNTYIIKSIVPKIYNEIIKPFFNGNGCNETQYIATFNYIDRILENHNKADFFYLYIKHVAYLLNKNIPEKEKALQTLTSIEWTNLKRIPFVDGNNSFPSDIEKWFTKTAKLQYELKQYKCCIETVDNALNGRYVTKFHYNGDIWLRRIKARSLVAENQVEAAIEIYKEILARHQTWFLYFELSEFYKVKNDNKEVLNYLVKSCLSRDADPSKCGKLYTTIGKILYENESTHYEAFVHLAFYKKIYEENQYKIPNEYLQLYETLRKQFDEPKDMKRFLEQYWIQVIESNVEKITGIITKILPNGKAGFISYDQNKNIYFPFSNLKFSRRKAVEGKKVSFVIGKSFDVKRNRESTIAEYICEDSEGAVIL